jgi:hypothetical protein
LTIRHGLIQRTYSQRTPSFNNGQWIFLGSVRDFNIPLILDRMFRYIPMLPSVLLAQIKGTWWGFIQLLGKAHGLLNGNRRNYHFLWRSNMKICEKCQGSMVVERAIDLEVGLSILYFACLNCGKRIQAEKEPRPLVH